MRPNYSQMTEGEALYSLGVRPFVKKGQKGIYIPAPGRNAEPLFIPASDEKPDCIIASEHKENRLKGSKKTRCSDCRRHVYISPSTQKMLERYPGTPVICTACFVKRAENEERENDTNG